MILCRYILTLTMMLCTIVGFSRERCSIVPDSSSTTATVVERNYIIKDTITNLSSTNLRLYDSIQAKTNRRAFPRMIYQMLFIDAADTTAQNGAVVDEESLYTPYKGSTIGRITIEREEPFSADATWFERAGNKLHITTRERVIMRDLLIRTGDKLDPQQLVRNKQLLRSRDYISDAGIRVEADSLNPDLVNVIVRTRDNWTISADLNLGGGNETMFGVYDANIFGTGNKLTVKTYFNRSDFDYGGNMLSYDIPNLFGSFFSANISGGRNFLNSELRVGLRKGFIRPTDYEAGITFDDLKSSYYMVDRDSAEQVKVRNIEAWSGYSHHIPRLRSSIFITGRYSKVFYAQRPNVSLDYNPALHNYNRLLVGLGLHREKFYSANMVYGFGRREYLATGYRAEIVSGYAWEEFDERLYLGLGAKGGDFTPIGYLMGGFSLGSYINPSTGAWNRSAVDINIRWFSNLFSSGRSRIRQFASINYTQGWNRASGSDEIIRFTSQNGLRTLQESITGINRAVINTETVLFTPFQPLGFRFAIFAFADFGLLGYNANPLRNEFCSSFGLGLRIKNERLIFSAIQIEVGFSVGKRGWLDSKHFRTSNETRIEQYRYIPSRPEIVGFR